MNVTLPPSRGSALPATILLVCAPASLAHFDEELVRDKVRNEVYVVGGSAEAMAVLRGAGVPLAPSPPDLILLDHHLPEQEKSRLLEEVRGDPAFREIPVVIVAGSREEAEVARRDEPGAAAYLIGPVRFKQLAEVVQSIPELGISILTATTEVSPPVPMLVA